MENVKKVVPEITKSVFCQQVKDGMTRSQLREHYGLSANSLKKVLDVMNVEPAREKRKLFTIVDDVKTTENVNNREIEVNIQ